MRRALRPANPPDCISVFDNDLFGPISLGNHGLESNSLLPNVPWGSLKELRYDEGYKIRASFHCAEAFTVSDPVEIEFKFQSHQAIKVPCITTLRQYNIDGSETLEAFPSRQPVLLGSQVGVDHLFGVIVCGPELFIPRDTSHGERQEIPAKLTNDLWDVEIFRFLNTSDLFKNRKQYEGRISASHWFSATLTTGISETDQLIEDLLNNLSQTLSYVRGARVGLLHVCGFSATKLKFLRLGSTRQHPMGEAKNWFDCFLTTEVSELFNLITLANRDAEKCLPLSRAIEYYVLGNSLQKTSIEAALIMSVSSLETLSDAILGSKLLGEMKRNPKERLAGAIRRSALQLGILSQPSEGLLNLDAWIRGKEAQSDGFSAITQMRNSATHSAKIGYDGIEIFEAWQAAQWLCEVMIAVWIGYRGNFSDRRTKRHVGEQHPISVLLR